VSAKKELNYKNQQYGGGSTVFFAVGVNWPSPKFQFETIDYIGDYGHLNNTAILLNTSITSRRE